jgi:ABC-type uncharacterized transport system permease subunit
LNAQSIEVYDLSQDVIRCDATTVSGAHAVTAGGLLQFGRYYSAWGSSMSREE